MQDDQGRSEAREPRRFYVAGGTLDPESPSYLVRDADETLYDQLREDEYCYVLNSRQTGKSSLMTRVARRLEAAGTLTATVDLSQIGGRNADHWYYGILHEIVKDVLPQVDLAAWWEKSSFQAPAHRFTEAIGELVLARTEQRVVVFVDEIDKTLERPFADDFFGAIRGFYNARSRTPAYRRLSFVLLGVASPGELVKDARITPFNIGVSIELQDFTRPQCRPLLDGLGISGETAEQVLSRVLRWSDGHPYLTQKLFQAFARKGDPESPEESVDHLVHELFLTPGKRRQEHNFDDVQRRLCSDSPELRRKQLKLYRRALQKLPLRDEPQSLPVSRLKLTGLVKSDGAGGLKVRNEIYRRVFDREWTEKLAPRRVVEQLIRGFLAAVIAVPVIWGAIAGFSILSIRRAVDDVPLSYFATLDQLGLRGSARSELAAYRDRLADRARERGDPAEELLQKLRALALEDLEERQYQVFALEQELKELEKTAELPAGRRVLAVDADGDGWVTTDEQGRGELWHLTSQQPIKRLGEATAAIFLPAVAAAGDPQPGSRRLLIGSTDGRLSLWRLDGQTANRTWSQNRGLESRVGHESPVSALAASSDGRWLASGGEDKSIWLWRLTDREQIPRPVLPLVFLGPVEHVAISSDGRWLAGQVGGQERTIQLWQLDQKPPRLKELRHREQVSTFGFSHDDQHLLVGTGAPSNADGALLGWELTTGGVAKAPRELRRESTVTVLKTAPNKLVTGHGDGSVVVWDARTVRPANPREPKIELERNQVLKGQRGPVGRLAIAANRQRIIAGSRRGRVNLWTFDSPSAQQLLKASGQVTELAFSSDLRRLATGDIDGGVQLWDPNDPINPTCQMRDASPRPPDECRSVASASSLAFHPRGRWLAAGYTDGYVKVWPLSEIDAGRDWPKFHVSRASVTVLRFGLDDGLLAAGSRDGRISLWTIGERVEHRSWLSEEGAEIAELELSPGGRWLRATRLDGSAAVWDLRADPPAAPISLPVSGRRITVSTFGPEDRWLAAGTAEVSSEPGFFLQPLLEVWDLKADPAGGPVAEANAAEVITSIAFADDGRRLITADPEGQIQHWFWSGRLKSLDFGASGDELDLSRARWPQSVLAAEFGRSRSDPLLILFRDRWVHAFSSLDGGMTWRESSFPFGVRWSGVGYRLAGDTIRLAAVVEDEVRMETIEILQKPAEEPNTRLGDWQRRLALILRPEVSGPVAWHRNWTW